MNHSHFKKLMASFLLAFAAVEGNDSILENSMSCASCHDVCNLNRIYNNDYQYSLPKKILEGFLSGRAFDNPKAYTSDELDRLESDIDALYQNILSKKPAKENLAIMTAGAPGAGKTTLLRQDLEVNAKKGSYYAYVCPDDVCLKNQKNTYLKDIASGDQSKLAGQAAYNKWRPGSNAATHIILGNLIREKYGFYFGTTSTGPATGKFFEFLKSQNYKIKLLHVTAPDVVRWNSIKERDKTFVQTTEQDVHEKGLLLPQRINDAFLKYADEIEFYFRSSVKQDAVLAASWFRNEDASEFSGTLHILDAPSYEKLKAVHNKAIETLNMPELLWEDAVEAPSKIIETKSKV